MRRMLWVLLVVVLAGCQRQSAPPTATASYLAAEPMPPEIAQLLEQDDHAAALVKLGQMISERPKDAMLYSIRSTVYHRQGHRDEAIADLNKAIELNGKDARLFNNRGFVLMGLQQFSTAMADFDQATKLAPDYSNPYNNRGLLMIAKGQYASAIEQLDQAVRLDPGYVDAYNNRGFAALQAGNIDGALADFNTAIKLNPKYVNAFNNRGLLRARVGDLDNAIIDFTNAMVMDPLNPKYYEHRCEIYRKLSETKMVLADEAKHDWLLRLQELSSSILAKPKDINLLLERARHHLAGDDQSKAMDDVQRALKIDPKFVGALLVRGRIHLDLNDYQNALADANAALKIEPQQEAYSLRGDACLGLKDYDKAIENYATARRIDASVAEAYYGKSQVLQASGQVEAAAEILKQAHALDAALANGVADGQPIPDQSDSDPVSQLLKTAGEHLAKKDASKAMDDVQSALLINPKSLAALLFRGRIHLELKDFQNALGDADTVLGLEPKQEAYSLRGDACLGLKDYDKAIESYAQARRIDASVAEAYYGKSKALQAAGQAEAAAEILKRAQALDPALTEGVASGRPTSDQSEIDPNDISTLLKTARELLAENKPSKAMEEIQTALAINPKSTEALLLRGRIFLEAKDFRNALRDADAVLGIEPQQEAHSLRGDACLGLKDYDKAIESFAQARRIDAAVAEAYYRNSLILRAAGKPEAAAESLKHAKAMDPAVTERLR